MEFVIGDYIWLIIAGVVVVMTIIGYIADKTDFGKKDLTKKATPVKKETITTIEPEKDENKHTNIDNNVIIQPEIASVELEEQNDEQITDETNEFLTTSNSDNSDTFVDENVYNDNQNGSEDQNNFSSSNDNLDSTIDNESEELNLDKSIESPILNSYDEQNLETTNEELNLSDSDLSIEESNENHDVDTETDLEPVVIEQENEEQTVQAEELNSENELELPVEKTTLYYQNETQDTENAETEISEQKNLSDTESNETQGSTFETNSETTLTDNDQADQTNSDLEIELPSIESLKQELYDDSEDDDVWKF